MKQETERRLVWTDSLEFARYCGERRSSGMGKGLGCQAEVLEFYSEGSRSHGGFRAGNKHDT